MQPPLQDPFYRPPLTSRDAALVAGFLLHYRTQILNALWTFGQPAVEQIPEWAQGMRGYWQDAERYNRYLLWVVGYPVAKGETWPGWEYLDPTSVGPPG